MMPQGIRRFSQLLDESVLVGCQTVLVTLLPTHTPIFSTLMPCMFLSSPRAQPFGRPETRADPAVAQQPGHPGAAGAPSPERRLLLPDEVVEDFVVQRHQRNGVIPLGMDSCVTSSTIIEVFQIGIWADPVEDLSCYTIVL
jgi:hypothetical protein